MQCVIYTPLGMPIELAKMWRACYPIHLPSFG